MRHLCDSNVFVALAVSGHQHHPVARASLDGLSDGDTAEFCRMKQNYFLRLVTTDAFMKPHTLSNEQALETLRTLRSDGRIAACLEEPLSLEMRWFAFATATIAAPLRWMDAYLAAFAIESGMRYVTFDRGFKKFAPMGLDLLLLSPETPARI